MNDGSINLREFLENSNLEVAKVPPWVHSTSVSKIWQLKTANKILAMPCDVFRPEKLCYCFVGRPAYKQEDLENPQHWQLPMAFVLRFAEPPPIKRVFPFDSGAFKARRLPSYITEFNLSGFDIASDYRNVGRLISLVYKTPRRYFDRNAAGFDEVVAEHELTLQHQEVQAVSQLALDNSNKQCDDRAAAIEISLGQDIVLSKENLLGVVVPDEVMRCSQLVDWLHSVTNCIKTYRHFPLSLYSHYALVYSAVEDVYKNAGVRL